MDSRENSSSDLLANPLVSIRDPTDVAVMKDIREKGFSIVRAVSSEKADEIYSQFWDWLEGLGSGIVRDKPKSWGTQNWPWNIHGILKNYSIGQAPFVWEARQQQGVLDAFSNIWRCKEKDLITSYDGACIIRPSEHYKSYSKNPWDHVDQNYMIHNDFQNVQGVFNLVDSGPEDGGLVVYPYTQLQHKEYYRRHKKDITKSMGNWIRMEQNDEIMREQRGVSHSGRMKICAPKGCLLLWDSRTVHCNEAPAKDRNFQEFDKFRACSYICMKPRKFSNEKELKKRVTYFEDGRTTSHYPTNVRVNAKNVRALYKDPIPQQDFTPVKLNSKIARLVGYSGVDSMDFDD